MKGATGGAYEKEWAPHNREFRQLNLRGFAGLGSEEGQVDGLRSLRDVIALGKYVEDTRESREGTSSWSVTERPER